MYKGKEVKIEEEILKVGHQNPAENVLSQNQL